MEHVGRDTVPRTGDDTGQHAKRTAGRRCEALQLVGLGCFDPSRIQYGLKQSQLLRDLLIFMPRFLSEVVAHPLSPDIDVRQVFGAQCPDALLHDTLERALAGLCEE